MIYFQTGNGLFILLKRGEGRVKILGFDVQEWSGLFALIGATVTVFRLFVIKPLARFIDTIVINHIEPLTEAIDRNTESMKIAKAEHKQIGKRLDVAEDRLEDHEDRILRLEGGDKDNG